MYMSRVVLCMILFKSSSPSLCQKCYALNLPAPWVWCNAHGCTLHGAESGRLDCVCCLQAVLLSRVCIVQTWGNRADALVRQAELLAEVTPAQLGENAVGQSFAEALQAYEKACSMTSSEQGDDLPGLLHNWGVGLRSMADLQQVLSLSQTCSFPAKQLGFRFKFAFCLHRFAIIIKNTTICHTAYCLTQACVRDGFIARLQA